jgi:NAD-dependent oxidoreductase involved in siderophore biosynthesis
MAGHQAQWEVASRPSSSLESCIGHALRCHGLRRQLHLRFAHIKPSELSTANALDKTQGRAAWSATHVEHLPAVSKMLDEESAMYK